MQTTKSMLILCCIRDFSYSLLCSYFQKIGHGCLISSKIVHQQISHNTNNFDSVIFANELQKEIQIDDIDLEKIKHPYSLDKNYDVKDMINIRANFKSFGSCSLKICFLRIKTNFDASDATFS
ncbi:MAG: hypothetical protein IKS92_12225 [Victivallales bacterium]|nr:hypothetical protein [Victivallales bacterium]